LQLDELAKLTREVVRHGTYRAERV